MALTNNPNCEECAQNERERILEIVKSKKLIQTKDNLASLHNLLLDYIIEAIEKGE